MPKKKRGRKLQVAIGDTVRLSRGRIGLVRFIGKTFFSLGEWIGIELYNDTVRTRHNGAVLGRRYFRCPPRRGVFIRRSLIKENIAVLDIQPSIKKLRAKEKKLKNQHKKKQKQHHDVKQQKNQSKRQAKRLKIQAKYSMTKPSKIKMDSKSTKTDKLKQRSATPTSTRLGRNKNTKSRKGRSKSPSTPQKVGSKSYSFQSTRRKQRARTPTDPKKKTKKRSKTPTPGSDKNKKKKKHKEHRTSSTSSKSSESKSSDNEDDEFPSLPNVIGIAEPIIPRKVKVKYNSDYMLTKKQKKALSHSIDLTKQFKDIKIDKFIADEPILTQSKSTTLLSKLKKAKSKTMDDVDRESSPSLSRESIDLPIIRQEVTHLRSETEPQIMNKQRKKVVIGDADGVCDSDDSSLNEDEDEDMDEDMDDDSDFEEDFEQNFEDAMKSVDEYANTIDDIEIGRKILANKVVQATKRRISQDRRASQEQQHVQGRVTASMIGGRNRANGLSSKYKKRRAITATEQFKRKKPNTLAVAMATSSSRAKGKKRRSSKQFDVARSRRGSSFVDDYNLNCSLFFDGDEESYDVHNDIVEDEDDDDEDEKQEPNQGETFSDITKHMESSDAVITLPRGDATPTILEGDEPEEEEEEEDETDASVDPLLGTIEDIIEEEHSEYEDEEEEFKIFDIEKDTAEGKVMVFYAELNEFIEWDLIGNEHTIMIITKVNDNDYGKALNDETGIESGWVIDVVNGNDTMDREKSDILSEIEECNVDDGYTVTFKRNEIVDDINNTNVSPLINAKNNLKPSLYMKSKKQSE